MRNLQLILWRTSVAMAVLTGAMICGWGCGSSNGMSAREAREATDPPYAKGTFGTPSDPAWPHDAPYGGGGGGRR